MAGNGRRPPIEALGLGLVGTPQTSAKWRDSAALGLVFAGLSAAGSGVAVLFLHHLPWAWAIVLIAVGLPVTAGGFAYHLSLVAAARAGQTPGDRRAR